MKIVTFPTGVYTPANVKTVTILPKAGKEYTIEDLSEETDTETKLHTVLINLDEIISFSVIETQKREEVKK